MHHVNHFIALPLDLHKELCEIARERGINVSDFLVESVLNAVEDHHSRLDVAGMHNLICYDPDHLVRKYQ